MITPEKCGLTNAQSTEFDALEKFIDGRLKPHRLEDGACVVKLDKAPTGKVCIRIQSGYERKGWDVAWNRNTNEFTFAARSGR